MTVPLCDHCCNRASEMCRDSCAEGPVVECSRHGVTNPSPVLARACSLCLGHAAPGETCRACGGQGEPFITSCHGGPVAPSEPYLVGSQGCVDPFPMHPDFKITVHECDCERLKALLARMLDPEDFGWAVNSDVRNAVREALGMPGREPKGRA